LKKTVFLSPAGFTCLGVNTGLRLSRPDTGIIISEKPMTAAGVFSQNLFRSLSLDRSISLIKKPVRVQIVFSGNANACTGQKAVSAMNIISRTAGTLLNCRPEEILLSFTGVIGRTFPADAISANLQKILSSPPEQIKKQSAGFPRAIMTTDLSEKISCCRIFRGKHSVVVSGCAKGSGMIYPNMATMLAYILTDAAVEKKYLDSLVKDIAVSVFNRISVDGDTSTNDSFLVFANGCSGRPVASYSEKKVFEKALHDTALQLARAIVADGEGATKFITICAEKVSSVKDAEKIVRAIANSSLVKTTIFGADPNWGRIICAAGNSGAIFNPAKVSLFLNNRLVFKNLSSVPGALPRVKKSFSGKNIEIRITINNGRENAHFFTCDFSYEYIKINADYTT